MKKIKATADETWAWANRPNRRWPCSTIAGINIEATLDDGALVELVVDGCDPERIDGHELTAFIGDVQTGEFRLGCDAMKKIDLMDALVSDLRRRTDLDQVARLLDDIDPAAAYWISELYEDPEHISAVMQSELRQIAGRDGKCLVHDDDGFRFEPAVPWYYRRLRREGYPAHEALWIARSPFIECYQRTVPIGPRGILEDSVLIDIGPKRPAIEISRRQKRQLRRNHGVTTEIIQQLEAPAWRVAVTWRLSSSSIAFVPEGDPYIMNATIWEVVRHATGMKP